jgi:hypothetical protein
VRACVDDLHTVVVPPLRPPADDGVEIFENRHLQAEVVERGR